MFCRFCGTALVARDQKFCINCGRSLEGQMGMAAPVPEKKKSGVGAFFLSLLKCLCYFAVFYGAMTGVQAVYMAVIMVMVPGMGMEQGGYLGYSQQFWDMFSKNICWVTIASYALAFLVYLIFFACRKKKLSEETGIHRVHFGALPAAFVFGIALQVVTVFAISFFSALVPAVAENVAGNDEMNTAMYASSSQLSQIVMMAVTTPIIEELVFRGLIYTRMKKAMPKAAAMILSSVVFGAVHSFGVQLVYAAILGFVLVSLYEKYNSLWVPILLHAGFNATNFLYDLIDMESVLMQMTVFAVALGFVLVFVAYFFISKPIYAEEKSDEAL